MNMDSSIKYVKLSTGDELLTILEKPEGGLFHFKHPIKISSGSSQESMGFGR